MTEPFSLHIDERGCLTLQRPGKEDLSDVRVRRAFPWSDPSRFVSIRNKQGEEILLIENLDEQPPEQRAIITEWLSASSFIPKILKVIKVDVRFGFQQWKVTTDRGDAEFRVQEREDIRFMPDGRFSVKDADGNLYELGALPTLDEASQRAVESLI